MILDFAGDVRRHGPVDNATISTIGRLGSIASFVSTTTCPQCQEENTMGVRACVCCGHVFVSNAEPPRIYVSPMHRRQARHSATADNAPIITTLTPPDWLPVYESDFRLHHKRSDTSAPPTLRVDHLSDGLLPYSEYISFESVKEYPRQFAHRWWTVMGGRSPVPAKVVDAIARRHELGQVLEIQIIREGQWWRINRRRVQHPNGVLIEIDSKYRCSRVIPQSEAAEITARADAARTTAQAEAVAATKAMMREAALGFSTGFSTTTTTTNWHEDA
jgi:DNA repair protein RadD